MKIKIAKKQLDEVVGTVAAGIAIGTILVLALAAFYRSLRPVIQVADKKLQDVDRNIKLALEQLSPEERKPLEEEINRRKQELAEASKT